MENTSGQGRLTEVPDEIKKWNWGAFFLNWIWGLGNQTYIALLCFIPIVNIVMPFVLGVKGSEWAWQNKRWENIEHFKSVQKKWAYWGIGIFILCILFILITSIPKYVALQDEANRAARDGSVAKIRAAVVIYYAETAIKGDLHFPSKITGDLFDDGIVPASDFGGYTWSYDSRTHTVTTN